MPFNSFKNKGFNSFSEMIKGCGPVNNLKPQIQGALNNGVSFPGDIECVFRGIAICCCDR